MSNNTPKAGDAKVGDACRCPHCGHRTKLKEDYEPREYQSSLRYEYWDCEVEDCDCHGACEIEGWV